MESPKSTTRGENLYEGVSGVIERLKVPWSKLANVTKDGLPNLTGNKVEFVYVCLFITSPVRKEHFPLKSLFYF